MESYQKIGERLGSCTKCITKGETMTDDVKSRIAKMSSGRYKFDPEKGEFRRGGADGPRCGKCFAAINNADLRQLEEKIVRVKKEKKEKKVPSSTKADLKLFWENYRANKRSSNQSAAKEEKILVSVIENIVLPEKKKKFPHPILAGFDKPGENKFMGKKVLAILNSIGDM